MQISLIMLIFLLFSDQISRGGGGGGGSQQDTVKVKVRHGLQVASSFLLLY